MLLEHHLILIQEQLGLIYQEMDLMGHYIMVQYSELQVVVRFLLMVLMTMLLMS